MGAKDLAGHPGEKITEGLDGLRERLAEYSRLGARFAKWRAVIAIGKEVPSPGCIEANAHALARYAALCQEAGLVPVVEPEVLMDGDHSLQRCFEVTEKVLRVVFFQLHAPGVVLEGMVLKPNMVVPGLTCPTQESVDEVADATVSCLLRAVPAAVPAIAFLLWRAIGRAGFCTFERDEYSLQIAVALGGGIFVCPRYPATGVGAVEGPGCERAGSAAGFISPRADAATGPLAGVNIRRRWRRNDGEQA